MYLLLLLIPVDALLLCRILVDALDQDSEVYSGEWTAHYLWFTCSAFALLIGCRLSPAASPRPAVPGGAKFTRNRCPSLTLLWPPNGRSGDAETQGHPFRDSLQHRSVVVSFDGWTDGPKSA